MEAEDVNPARPEELGAVRATLWALLALVVLFGIQIVASIAAFSIRAVSEGAVTDEEIEALVDQMPLVGPEVPITFLVSAPLIYLIVRRAAKPLEDRAAYLGLRWPVQGAIAPAVLLLGVFFAISIVGDAVFDRPFIPDFTVQLYATRETLGIVGLWLAVAVAAPLCEELIYRGLLLPAWASTAIGPIGASVAVSLLWAATHVQYEISYQIEIFILGLGLAAIRLRFNSLAAPLGIHIAANTLSILIAEWHLSEAA